LSSQPFEDCRAQESRLGSKKHLRKSFTQQLRMAVLCSGRLYYFLVPFRNAFWIVLLILISHAWNGADLTAQTVLLQGSAPVLRSGLAGHHAAMVGNPAGFVVTSATTTELTLTPSGTVDAGTPIELTATITAGSSSVLLGTVNFCDATATYCEDSALLGTAQLTPAGSASIKLTLGIGTHSIKAVFAGTNAVAASTSTAQTITVTGLYASETSIKVSGSPGDYTLTATVAGSNTETPTGGVSFLDTANGNMSLGTVPLGVRTATVWGFNPLPANLVVDPGGVGVTGEGDGVAVAVGDFNGDGKQDLVVVSGNIFLGNGDGTFANPISLNVTAESVAVGDLNGDGKQDLVFAGFGQLKVLLGNGDGTFQQPVVYTVGDGFWPMRGVAVGDFNRDGKLDIAVPNSDRISNGVSILLGNGDGTFQPAVTYDAGTNADGVVDGDFNDDGVPDLAVINNDLASGSFNNSTIHILLGNGDGAFQAPTSYVIGVVFPNAIVVGDFNSDGKPDLAVASDGGPPTVSILLGNGNGTFQNKTEFDVLYGPVSMAVGDFNQDGKLDLAFVANNISLLSNSFAVFLGNGDGTFQKQTTYPDGEGPYAVAVGDFNGDGKQDLAGPGYDLYITLGTASTTAKATFSSAAVPSSLIHYVVASYQKDITYSSSLSSTTLAFTTTTLLTTPRAVVGGPVTLNASVWSPLGRPTGTVTFQYGSTILGTASLNNSAAASLITTFLPLGTDEVTATYGGSSSYAPSTSPAAHVVISPAPSNTILAQTFPADYCRVAGDHITLTATVQSQLMGTPSGYVTFLDYSQTLATVIE